MQLQHSIITQKTFSQSNIQKVHARNILTHSTEQIKIEWRTKMHKILENKGKSLVH